jgi:hypothetical protein
VQRDEGRCPLKSTAGRFFSSGLIGYRLNHNPVLRRFRFRAAGDFFRMRGHIVSAIQQRDPRLSTGKPLCLGKNPLLFSIQKQRVVGCPKFTAF